MNDLDIATLDGVCRDRDCEQPHCAFCSKRHAEPGFCARCTHLLATSVEDLMDVGPRLREAQISGRNASAPLPGGDATVMLNRASWDDDVEMLSHNPWNDVWPLQNEARALVAAGHHVPDELTHALAEATRIARHHTEVTADLLHPAAVLGSWTTVLGDWIGWDEVALMAPHEVIEWAAARPEIAVPMLTDVLAALAAARRVMGGGFMGQHVKGVDASRRERTLTFCPDCETARLVRIGGENGVLVCPRPQCGVEVQANEERAWTRLLMAHRDDVWPEGENGWENRDARVIAEPVWVPLENAAEAIGRHTERVRRWFVDGRIRGQVERIEGRTSKRTPIVREVLHVCLQDLIAEDAATPRRTKKVAA